MEEEIKKIVVDLDANTQEFDKKMQESVEKLKKTEGEFKNFKELLGEFSTAFVSFGTGAYRYADELHGALNRVENAFGKNSEGVKDFAKNTLHAFGIAESSALSMSASFGDLGSVIGINQEQAANMGMGLTALAGDLASFKNVQTDVASSALKGIFTGDTKALQELGIALTNVNLEDFAKKSGFKETYAHMNEAEKAALRYGFVLNQTRNIQGDFAKNSNDSASQMQIFSESVKELYASFGEVLLPVLSKGINILNSVIQFFKDLDPSVKKSIFVIGGLAASIVPLMSGFEKAKTVIQLMSTALQPLWNGLKIVRNSITTLIPLLGSLSLPIIGIGLVVAGAAVAIIANWDKIAKTLQDTGIWEIVTKVAKYALGLVIEIVDAFGNLFTGNWKGLWGNIKNILVAGWNNIINIVSGGIKAVMKLQIKLYDALGMKGLSKGAANGIVMIDKLADVFKIKSETITKTGEKFAKKLSSFNFSFDWPSAINDDPETPQETPKTKAAPALLTKRLGDIAPLASKKSLFGLIFAGDDKSDMEQRAEELKTTLGEVFGGNKEQFISVVNDAMNGVDFGANLQKRFDSIQIKMPKHVLSNSEEVALEIENTFDRIREKFGEQSDATFSLLGTQIRQSIENGMKPEEAGQSIFESFQKIVEKIKEIFGENASMADFSEYGEQILQSMVSGLDVTKASDKVLGKIQQMNQALTKAVQDSLKATVDAVGDVVSGLFEQAVGGKKLNVKAFAGGLLSTLGGIAMDLGKTALSIGLGIEAIKTSLKTISGAGAIAAGIGLLALGGILKGVGNKLSGSASMGSTSGANSSPSSPGFKYANAPSYAMQKQPSAQSTNESVLRGGDVFWSGQRYEVIRGF